MYKIQLLDLAKQDFKYFKKTGNIKNVKRIEALIKNLEQDPYSGIGKPEALKYALSGLWSRRIDREHRLIYEVKEEEKLITILSFKGHYE